MLLAVLVIGLVGTSVELLLLGHDESLTQFVPLVLIAVSLTAIIWHAATGSSFSLLSMRFTMVAFIAAGALGRALFMLLVIREVDSSICVYEITGMNKRISAGTRCFGSEGLRLDE